MLERIEAFIREHGPDRARRRGHLPRLGRRRTRPASGTCSRELGYRVSALHVAHGLRGAESDEDARFCREELGAEVVEAPRAEPTEAELRDAALPVAADRLRATGHTASDQVETVLSASSRAGTPQRIKPRREDGVVRPLLGALARGDRGLLPRARAARTASTRRTRHEARPDPRRDPAAARAAPPARARTSCSRSRTSGRACRARSSARSPSCSRAAPARSASTSAAASRPCASTSTLWLEAEPVAAGRAAGRSSRERGARPRGPRLPPGRSARGPRARRCRICSWTRRCRAPSATAGRSSCAATRSSRCPGSSERPGRGKGAVTWTTVEGARSARS